jgi:hypothetical protein
MKPRNQIWGCVHLSLSLGSCESSPMEERTMIEILTGLPAHTV